MHKYDPLNRRINQWGLEMEGHWTTECPVHGNSSRQASFKNGSDLFGDCSSEGHEWVSSPEQRPKLASRNEEDTAGLLSCKESKISILYKYKYGQADFTSHPKSEAICSCKSCWPMWGKCALKVMRWGTEAAWIFRVSVRVTELVPGDSSWECAWVRVTCLMLGCVMVSSS